MDHDDPRVGQGGGGAGFGEEPLLVVCAVFGRERKGELDRLEGYAAVERRVVGLVDDTHHPAPELAPDLVSTERSGQLIVHVTRMIPKARSIPL